MRRLDDTFACRQMGEAPACPPFLTSGYRDDRLRVHPECGCDPSGAPLKELDMSGSFLLPGDKIVFVSKRKAEDMSDGVISKIELNDDDQLMRNKINQNFLVLCRRSKINGGDQQVIINSIGPQIIESMIDEVLNAVQDDIFDQVYPVGCGIYTNDPEDPRTKRGVWKKLENVFIVSASDTFPVGSAGGSSTVVLQTDNLPTHTHKIAKGSALEGSADYGLVPCQKTEEADSGATGNGAPVSIMPPYIAKYYFERVE